MVKTFTGLGPELPGQPLYMWTRMIAMQEFDRMSLGHPVSPILLVLVKNRSHNYINNWCVKSV